MFSISHRMVIMVATVFVVAVLALFSFPQPVAAAHSLFTNADDGGDPVAYRVERLKGTDSEVEAGKVVPLDWRELVFQFMRRRIPHYVAHVSDLSAKKGGCFGPIIPLKRRNHKVIEMTVSLKYCI